MSQKVRLFSEKARLLLAGLAITAGLALTGCGSDGVTGPGDFDTADRGEMSGLTVVPPADDNELELPDRSPARTPGGSGDGPALDDEGEPDWRDRDHR